VVLNAWERKILMEAYGPGLIVCSWFHSLWVTLRHSQYRDCIASNIKLIDELERIWKETVVV
jgi:hypothetical protein